MFSKHTMRKYLSIAAVTGLWAAGSVGVAQQASAAPATFNSYGDLTTATGTQTEEGIKLTTIPSQLSSTTYKTAVTTNRAFAWRTQAEFHNSNMARSYLTVYINTVDDLDADAGQTVQLICKFVYTTDATGSGTFYEMFYTAENGHLYKGFTNAYLASTPAGVPTC